MCWSCVGAMSWFCNEVHGHAAGQKFNCGGGCAFFKHTSARTWGCPDDEGRRKHGMVRRRALNEFIIITTVDTVCTVVAPGLIPSLTNAVEYQTAVSAALVFSAPCAALAAFCPASFFLVCRREARQPGYHGCTSSAAAKESQAAV